ncbi:MAG: DUF3800 domain-containing protein [Patescibacteria group bacterium]
MLIFIDESGDTGLKFNKGSSNYFVIVAVIFDDYAEANRVDRMLSDLKDALGFQNTEFKFNKSSHSTRIKFLKAIKNNKYRIHFLAVNKMQADRSKIFKNTGYFYIDAIKVLLNDKRISNAKIKIDGSGSSSFKKQFKSMIKKSLNVNETKIVKEITFVDSRSNMLIQMADMIAGSIRKSYEGNGEMKNIISKHIEVVHILP